MYTHPPLKQNEPSTSFKKKRAEEEDSMTSGGEGLVCLVCDLVIEGTSSHHDGGQRGTASCEETVAACSIDSLATVMSKVSLFFLDGFVDAYYLEHIGSSICFFNIISSIIRFINNNIYKFCIITIFTVNFPSAFM